jgi:putative FmdB family regulatory protein
MLYPYKCNNCGNEAVIEKPMADSNRDEVCDKCGTIMQRVFKLFGIKTSDGIK